MKKLLILGLIGSLAFSKVVSFDEVLKETLKNNLSLKAKKLNIKKAKARLEEAKGYDFGKLIFSEEVARTNNPLYVFGMKLESHEATFRDFGFSDFLGGIGQVMQLSNGDFKTFSSIMSNPALQNQMLNTAPDDLNNPKARTNFKTKLVYEVPIFTSFKLTYAKEMAKLQILANEFKYMDDKNALAIEVLKAYNGAVAAKYFIDALNKAKETTTSFVNMIESFYKEGMVTQIDLLEAKKRDAQVDAMLVEAESKYKLALSYLRFISDDYSITDVKDFKVIKPPTTSIAELQRIALKNRNDLKWMQKNLETMQKRVKFIRADKYPMVGAHLEYGFSDNSLTLDRDKDYYMLAAGLKWNIFDSSLGAKSEQAKIDAMQIAHYYEYMKKGIKLDVEQKLLNYKAKRAVVQEKITNKELAEEILKKYTYMYKQGMINITILLMKEAGARKARAELIKAKFEEALAAAELKKALGDFIKESK